LSTSKGRATDFDRWIVEAFAADGPFTVAVILLEIGETRVTPVRSTFLNVIGDEVEWREIAALFARAGHDWDGAAFFPATDDGGGALPDTAARRWLADVERRVEADRLALNDAQFFDRLGRRLRIDEVSTH